MEFDVALRSRGKVAGGHATSRWSLGGSAKTGAQAQPRNQPHSAERYEFASFESR